MEWVILLITGAVAGTLSGLLGIGGGLIVVPSLFYLDSLGYFGAHTSAFSPFATSLVVIIATTMSSVYAHYRRAPLPWDLYRRVALGLVLGILVGVMFASSALKSMLVPLFVLITLLLIIRLFLPQPKNTIKPFPRARVASSVMFVVGCLASMLGIGGGAMLNSIFLRFKEPHTRIVALAAMVSLTVGSVGTVAWLVKAWLGQGLHSAIYWQAGIIIGVMTVVCAPLGVRLAHYFSQRAIRFAMVVLLLVVATKMTMTYFT